MATGKFVMTAFTILVLVFVTDFAKISLSTDRVRPSKNPETWEIWPFVLISAILGILMVAESLFILWIGLSQWGLATNENMLYTFSFLTLLYFAAFSIVSARERHWFWKTRPSRTVLIAIMAEIFIGTGLTYVGLPGLIPLPWWQPLLILMFAISMCLVLNDSVKVAMIRWRVPLAAA
jgi:hypothetical protein